MSDDGDADVTRRMVQGFRRLDAWRQIAVGGLVGLLVVAGGRRSIFAIRELAIPISGVAVVLTELTALRSGWDDSPDSSAELVDDLPGLKLFTAAAAVAVGAAAGYTRITGDGVPAIAVYLTGIPIAGAVVLSRRTKPLFSEILERLYVWFERVRRRARSGVSYLSGVLSDKIGWL